MDWRSPAFIRQALLLCILLCVLSAIAFLSRRASTPQAAEQQILRAFPQETLRPWPTTAPAPEIRIVPAVHPGGGWDIHLVTHGFSFLAGKAATESGAMRGVVLLHLDGKPIAIAGKSPLHLSALSGDHVLTAVLADPRGTPFTRDGAIVLQTLQGQFGATFLPVRPQ